MLVNVWLVCYKNADTTVNIIDNLLIYRKKKNDRKMMISNYFGHTDKNFSPLFEKVFVTNIIKLL